MANNKEKLKEAAKARAEAREKAHNGDSRADLEKNDDLSIKQPPLSEDVEGEDHGDNKEEDTNKE